MKILKTLALLFYLSLSIHSADATSIVNVIGIEHQHAGDIVDVKPKADGNGVIAYLRRPGKLPEIIWYSNTWQIERTVQFKTPTKALSVTPAATKNDLLLVGNDGRVCAQASVKHPYGSGSWRIRWQVSCFGDNGKHLLTATSKSNERDIANGIVMGRNGGVSIIKTNQLLMLDAKGKEIQTVPINLKKNNVNNAVFSFDDGLIAFKHSLDMKKSSSLQRVKFDGRVEWDMPLPILDASGAIVRESNKGEYIFAVTDYDSQGERSGTRGYIGSITKAGKLGWLSPLGIKDARIVDFLKTKTRIFVVLAQGYGYSDGRTFIVSLSLDGEMISTWETSDRQIRVPEGLVLTTAGNLFVYGKAKNIRENASETEAFMQQEVPWIGKLEPKQ